MNIKRYRKYFKTWTVKTSTNAKDGFGIVQVGSNETTFKGYLSKMPSATRNTGDGIPETQSNGIMFTGPEVDLKKGDIIGGKYQVIDDSRFPSHNEFFIKYIDKW